MLSLEQVRIIERLREAAADHGEVADLLSMLAECIEGLDQAQPVLRLSAEDRTYLQAVLAAQAFVEHDRLGTEGRP